MRNERLLVVEDDVTIRKQIELATEVMHDEYGHEVVASLDSVSTVPKSLTAHDDKKPTVAIVDNLNGKGSDVARIIRRFSPGTIIVSYSGTDNVTWGDLNLSKRTASVYDVLEQITNFQH